MSAKIFSFLLFSVFTIGEGINRRAFGQVWADYGYTTPKGGMKMMEKFVETLVKIDPLFEIYNICHNILWDKTPRPHRKPFGLFYPLETYGSSHFFIHRTLHPSKIYSVKK